MTITFVERIFAGYFVLISVTLLAASAPSAFGQEKAELVHGLWVWKSAQVLEGDHSSENFARRITANSFRTCLKR
jgi:hypothetical protein